MIKRWLDAPMLRSACLLLILTLTQVEWAQAQSPDALPPMNNGRIAALLGRLDPQLAGQPGFWEFTINDRKLLLITDERANRMRVLSAVASAASLDAALMQRLMQANFDSALDARYALARGTLWSAFIHPLGPLDDEQLLSAIAQVVNLADTFGSTFSSGGPLFGGGDSNELLQELRDRARAI